MCVRVVITLLLWTSLAVRISPSQLKQPRILEQPTDLVVRKHEPATLNCKADGKPPPIIEWFHGEQGEKVHDTPNRMVLPSGSLFFLHVIHTKREQDTGTYWCVARNEVGKARSRNASLDVAALREDFRIIPKNIRVAAGDTAVLECSPPKGHPEPSIRWLKDGEPVNVGTGRLRLLNQGNLVVSDVRQGDKGRYVCVAENIVGTRESPAATLSVHVKPFFVHSPEHITALSGDQVEFECGVGGEPTPSITWRREDGKMPIGRAQILENKSLRIKNVLPADEGLYICEAENPVGILSASATLTVHSRPTFSKTPKDQKVGLNGIAKLECLATGNPPPSVFWTKEGDQVLMFPGRSYGQFSVNTQGTLVISGVNREDKGYYVCSALSVVGSTMAKAHLEVTAVADVPPPIIRKGPANQTLPLNTVAMLPCEASGKPEPVIRWAVHGASLDSSANDRVVVLDSDTLQINDLHASDSGVYTCTATSESGETSWSASLSVESPHNPNAIFHRTPDPSTFPGPPGRPRVLNVTETTVALTWRRSSQTGSSLLIGYTIEYYSGELQSGWVVAAHRVSGESHVVSNLRPDSGYIFLVRAENSHGMSVPSSTSDSIRTIDLPDHVLPRYNIDEARVRLSTTSMELAEVKPMTSVSVKLYWNIKGNREYVEGFYIRFRDLSGGSEKYNMVTVLNGAAQSYVLSDLRKFTKYEFFLVPFYKTVEGPPSNSRSVQTMEDVPSAPPDNLNIQVINVTSASISWSPPPPQHRNGILKGFTVFVLGNSSTIHSNLRTNATATSVTLTNLTVGYVYQVQAAALTTMGPGPFSTAVPLRMDLPSPSNLPNIQDVVRQPWFIAIIGGVLFILLSVFFVIIFLRRRLAWKKALGAHLSAIPQHKSEDVRTGVNAREALWLNHAWHPPASDKGNNMSETKLINKLDSSNDLNYSSVYSPILNNVNAADYAEVDTHNLSTFYKKEPPSLPGPYATTTLLNTPKSYSGSVKDHKSNSSEEYCRKSDKHLSMDNAKTLDADGNVIMLDAISPTSDSGSYTTDEYGMPIKKKRLLPHSGVRGTPKKQMMNWADLIPPPPEQPPSERGSPPNTPHSQRVLKPQIVGQPNSHSPLTSLRGQTPPTGQFASPRGTLTRPHPKYYPATQACDNNDRVPTPPTRGGVRIPGLGSIMGNSRPPLPPLNPPNPLRDRAIQSSLPSLMGDPHGLNRRHDGSLPHNFPVYPGHYQSLDGESDVEGIPVYATTNIYDQNGGHTPESSVGGEPDYAVTSDGSRMPQWVTDQSNSSCTSARSSGVSSSDGSFYTESDFASAITIAAQNAGMRVNGSRITGQPSDLPVSSNNHRRATDRPRSPYSTDSNFSNGYAHQSQHKSRKKPPQRQKFESNADFNHLQDSTPYSNAQMQDYNYVIPQSAQRGDDLPEYSKPSFPLGSNNSGSGASQSSSGGRRRNLPVVNGSPGNGSFQRGNQSEKNGSPLHRNYFMDIRDTPIV